MGEDYVTPKLDRLTQTMADSVSDNPWAMYLEAPGAALAMLPTNLRESVAQGVYGVGRGQFTDEMEQRIAAGEGTAADNIGRLGDAGSTAFRYGFAPELSIGSDVAGLFGRAIDVGPVKALGEAAQGFVSGMNPFEEGIDPFERASRALNLGMMLHGAVRGRAKRSPEHGPQGKQGSVSEGHRVSIDSGTISPGESRRALGSPGADGRYELPDTNGPRPPRNSGIPGKAAIMAVGNVEHRLGGALDAKHDWDHFQSFLKFLPKELLDTLRLRFEDRLPFDYRGEKTLARGLYDWHNLRNPVESLARISRNLADYPIGNDGLRHVTDTVVHEIAHHLEWFLTDADQVRLIQAFEEARDLHPSQADLYHYSNPSEWWAHKVVQFERQRFSREQDLALLPMYRRLLVRTHDFLTAALEYHRKRRRGDAVREIYDEMIRTRGKIKAVDGVVSRMKSVQDMDQWHQRVKDIDERLRSQPPMPRGVEGG